MTIITAKEQKSIIEKLSALSLAILSAEGKTLTPNGRDDLIGGIQDIVKDLGGDAAFAQYAAQVLGYYQS